MKFPLNAIMLFTNADKQGGKDFEEGLANLKHGAQHRWLNEQATDYRRAATDRACLATHHAWLLQYIP